MKGKQIVTFTINSIPYDVIIEPQMTLLEVLRDKLGLTGTKFGCGTGDCGVCTVLIDGRPVSACLTLAARVKGTNILTIEGLAKGTNLHPIQRAFIEHGAIQCGFCTPGMILNAKALLDENQNPTREEVRFTMGGNLCRCTGYVKIIDAILAAAGSMRKGSG